MSVPELHASMGYGPRMPIQLTPQLAKPPMPVAGITDQPQLQVYRAPTAPPLSAAAMAVEPQEQELDWMENAGTGSMRRRVMPNVFLADQEIERNPEYMNSGTYFTDLIATDVIGSSRDTQKYDAIVERDKSPAPAKGHQKRSKNFSDDEDILLVSAWLNMTLDPIQGVDQSRSTYRKRIHAFFYSNKTFDSDRTSGSLMNHWSGIQHDVNVFAGCLSKIEARNHSGWSVDDKHANPCAMFKAEDKLHRNFPYMHCWKILKDQPKWLQRRKTERPPKPVSKKQKTVAGSSPYVADVSATPTFDKSQATETELERTVGKKKEKQRLRQRAGIEALDYIWEKKKKFITEKELKKDLKKDERCKAALALQEERIRLDREKFEFTRKLEEDKIMNIDLSMLDETLRQYYEGRKREIIARRLRMG